MVTTCPKRSNFQLHLTQFSLFFWFVSSTQRWIDNDLIWIRPIAQIRISWINFVKVLILFFFLTMGLKILLLLDIWLLPWWLIACCSFLQLKWHKTETFHTENFASARRFIGCWPWECFGSHVVKLSFSVTLNLPEHQSLQFLHISASHPSTEASPWPLDTTHNKSWNKLSPHVGECFYSKTSPPILKIPSTRVESY